MPTIRRDGKVYVKYFKDKPEQGDRKLIIYNSDGVVNLTIQRVGNHIVSAGPGMMDKQINKGIMEFLNTHGNYYEDGI